LPLKSCNYLVTQKRELHTVVEYLEGRLTGRDFVCFMNAEVRRGQRTGKQPALPPTGEKSGAREQAMFLSASIHS